MTLRTTCVSISNQSDGDNIMSTKVYFFLMTMLACACAIFGWSEDAIIFDAFKFMSGFLFGHLITEILNDPKDDSL